MFIFWDHGGGTLAGFGSDELATGELSLDEMIFVVDSPSKLFCKEAEINSKWKFPIDKTSPMNIKTINDFMSSSPYFTKIDLDRLFTRYALKPMSFRDFARAVLATNSSNFYHDKGLDKDITIKETTDQYLS